VKRLGSAIVRSARHAPSVPVFERHSSFITTVARLKTRSYELAASTLNRITPTGSVGVPTSSEDDPKRKVLLLDKQHCAREDLQKLRDKYRA
jgi:hypothetical protein